MASFVTAASRLIDAEMGREPGFFCPTTDNITMYFDGSGEDEQAIGEWVSISAVAMSENGGVGATDYTVLVEGADYYVKPYNHTQRGKPISRLVMDAINNSKYGVWHRFRKGVRVDGVPGYSLTVPDTVALATRMQSVRWFMRAKTGYQDTGATVDMGGMIIKGQTQLDPDIKAILFPLKLELSA